MLTIQTETQGNVDVVRVIGRVDGSTAPQLDQALQGLIKQKRYNIVVDFTRAEFLASAGMRALLYARQQAHEHKGDLRLAGLSPFIQDALELVGFEKLFQIYQSPKAAIASF